MCARPFPSVVLEHLMSSAHTLRRPRSRHQRKKPSLYDCIGWLFSQLEYDGCANGFLNASHSFNVFLILAFQFLGWKKKNTEYIIAMRDAAYILRDAGQSSQFRDCPQNAGRVVTLTCVWDHFILNPDNVNCKHCYDVLKIKKRAPWNI